MIVGYDYSKASNTVCLAKSWDTRHVGGTIMLYACGTQVDQDAVLDGITPVLYKTAATLQYQMEQIALSSGADDLFYATTHLVKTFNEINSNINAISDFAGQGIYIGGVIMYHTARKFTLFPFGGGTVYTYANGILTPQGDLTEGPFIRDALGAAENWTCTPLQGSCSEHRRFIFTTQRIKDLEAANQIMSDTAIVRSHPNTVPMLLVRELVKTTQYPVAVMDILLTKNNT